MDQLGGEGNAIVYDIGAEWLDVTLVAVEDGSQEMLQTVGFSGYGGKAM